MPKFIDLSYATSLTPEKAIEYFQDKGYNFTWSWTEMLDEVHNEAFTVAKVMQMDILEDIREGTTRAIRDGITFQEFQNDMTPLLQEKGWWGRKVIDGQEVQLGSPWRLKTIFDTNVQSSYNAGRWKGFQDNKESQPFLQYVAVLDNVTRPKHRDLHGIVFPIDDPFWASHYPPLGYGCRCRARPLSKEMIESRGLKVADSSGKLHRRTVKTRKGGPETDVTVYRSINPQTGKLITVSPDPGFNFNTGVRSWKPNLKEYTPPLRRQYKKAVRAEAAAARAKPDLNAPAMAGKHKTVKAARAWAEANAADSPVKYDNMSPSGQWINNRFGGRRKSQAGKFQYGTFTLEQANQFNTMLHESNQLADDLGIPRLRGTVPNTGRGHANMGDGIMGWGPHTWQLGKMPNWAKDAGWTQRKYNDKVLEKIKLSKQAGWQPAVVGEHFIDNVDDLFAYNQDTFWHEFGHHIHQQINTTNISEYKGRPWTPMEIKIRDLYRDLLDRLDPDVMFPSKYSKKNFKEWFAESYSAHKMGRDDLVAAEFLDFLKDEGLF